MKTKYAYKKDGKWQTVVTKEINQFGNPRISINKPAFRAALEGDGWLNLSIFEDEAKESPKGSAPAVPDFGDEVPFAPCIQ